MRKMKDQEKNTIKHTKNSIIIAATQACFSVNDLEDTEAEKI